MDQMVQVMSVSNNTNGIMFSNTPVDSINYKISTGGTIGNNVKWEWHDGTTWQPVDGAMVWPNPNSITITPYAPPLQQGPPTPVQLTPEQMELVREEVKRALAEERNRVRLNPKPEPENPVAPVKKKKLRRMIQT
jgi:hypothetical protein